MFNGAKETACRTATSERSMAVSAGHRISVVLEGWWEAIFTLFPKWPVKHWGRCSQPVAVYVRCECHQGLTHNAIPFAAQQRPDGSCVENRKIAGRIWPGVGWWPRDLMLRSAIFEPGWSRDYHITWCTQGLSWGFSLAYLSTSGNSGPNNDGVLGISPNSYILLISSSGSHGIAFFFLMAEIYPTLAQCVAVAASFKILLFPA